MNKIIFVLIAIMSITSCSTSRVVPVYNKHHDAPIIRNPAKAITYGVKPSAIDIAKKQGIVGRGGIKQGYVVVMPSSPEWKGIFARAPYGKAMLHIKPIKRGDSIAMANRYISDGRIGLDGRQVPTLPLLGAPINNNCKIILDGTGQPITLRDNEKGINRYGFHHFINDKNYEYQKQQSEVAGLESQWQKQGELLARVKSNITNSRAYRKGQCVKLKQRPVPPAPKRIDPKKIAINAHGACVNLIGSRFTEEQVIEALESAGQWNVTKNYQKWIFGKKMSCAAGVSIPEFESLKTRAINWFAPNLGKEYFRQAIRTDIYNCIAQVKSRCDDGYGSWVTNKHRIISEPKRLKKQCEANKLKLANYDYSEYNKVKTALDKAKVLGANAYVKQKAFDKNTLTPFNDKRTYCKL